MVSCFSEAEPIRRKHCRPGCTKLAEQAERKVAVVPADTVAVAAAQVEPVAENPAAAAEPVAGRSVVVAEQVVPAARNSVVVG